MDSAPISDQGFDTPPYDQQTMLNMVRVEMERSVGFENDQTLKADRLRALNFYQGQMKTDIPSLPNRSSAVSTDVADAVEAALPDIMEIFTSQGDVATFLPNRPGDEDAARQETEYLHHVIFQDNPGFLNLMTGFKDGLLLKTCLFEFGWKKDHVDEEFSGKSLPELIAASQSGQVINVKADPQDADYPSAQQTYSFAVRQDCSKAEYWPVPPDDFSVSPDTIRVSETTYCVARSRPRVQDLIAEGYDAKIVMSLEPYAPQNQDEMQRARDTAGEHEQGETSDDTTDMLRQVEVRKHFIRLKEDDGDDFVVWKVVTDSGATKVIPYDGKYACRMERVPFAAGSPYLVPHRFYGISLAEQLFEVQKIKTVLTRSLLDSSYFALNQRFEVSMDQVSDYTISDLLRNEPAVPVRSKTGQALRPLNAGGLTFDAYAALEYFSTVGEGRSGVVRNSQGLNPDTLHDTAKGTMMLMQNAQRRIRMIARILAETCVKELYLGLHALIRENSEGAKKAYIGDEWVDIDPTTWGERNAMSIEVGLGSAGTEKDLAAFQIISQDMLAIVQEQKGLNGPLVTADHVYNLAIDKYRALGRKQPQRYIGNPKTMPPQQEPAPDPKIVVGQMQQQTALQKAGIDAQVKQNATQTQAILKAQQTQTEAALKKYEIDQSNATEIATAAIDGHVKHKVAQVGVGGDHV